MCLDRLIQMTERSCELKRLEKLMNFVIGLGKPDLIE